MRLAIAFSVFALALSVQSTKPTQQVQPQVNPGDSAKTQLEVTQCSAEQYREADARLNALHKQVTAMMGKNIAPAQHTKDADQNDTKTWHFRN
jgi:uncharacterized protein YecT (DUF1311 family)